MPMAAPITAENIVLGVMSELSGCSAISSEFM